MEFAMNSRPLEGLAPQAQAIRRRRNMRRIAAVGSALILGLAVLIVLYEAYLGLHPEALSDTLNASGIVPAVPPTPGTFFAIWLINVIPAAIFVVAIWNVRRLLRLLASEHIFHPDLPALLRRLGRLAIASAVATAIARTLTLLAVTLANPPGQRQITIGIGSGEATALIIGLLLYALAIAMQEALLLEEDNRSIV